MGIYVKGMTVPKNCCDCPCFNDFGYYFCNLDDERRDVYDDRPEWCPLVEIPTPHGRLIDADALVPDVCHDWEDSWYLKSDDYSEKCIRNAPTVIEAED